MEWINFICDSCQHNVEHIGYCKAFPKGIPSKIIDTNKHYKPIKGQQNKLVYTRTNKAK
jgi:hypothetical protein